MFLKRDEKEERKKQARSNKQTHVQLGMSKVKQTNTCTAGNEPVYKTTDAQST